MRAVCCFFHACPVRDILLSVGSWCKNVHRRSRCVSRADDSDDDDSDDDERLAVAFCGVFK